jgi:hypothetical protein
MARARQAPPAAGGSAAGERGDGQADAAVTDLAALRRADGP